MVQSRTIRATSAGVSATCSSSSSPSLTLPSAATRPRSHSSRPLQYALSYSTTGNRWILPVCTSVTASNSSSSVPKPPGNTTNASEYFTNIVFRTKK